MSVKPLLTFVTLALFSLLSLAHPATPAASPVTGKRVLALPFDPDGVAYQTEPDPFSLSPRGVYTLTDLSTAAPLHADLGTTIAVPEAAGQRVTFAFSPRTPMTRSTAGVPLAIVGHSAVDGQGSFDYVLGVDAGLQVQLAAADLGAPTTAVLAIPEPEISLLMFAGLGAIAMAVLRRRRE